MSIDTYCGRAYFYYVPEHAGPEMEYCVSSGILTGCYDGAKYTELCIRGYEPGKDWVLRRYKTAGLGKCAFLNPWDAANLAASCDKESERPV